MRLAERVYAVVGGSAQTGSPPSVTAGEGMPWDPSEPWARAIAKRLAMEGAQVVLLDPDGDWLQRTCAEIAAFGGQAEAVVLDVGDYAALDGWARDRAERGLPLHGLVTCYLDIDWHSIEQADIEAFDRVIAFNLGGPVKATKALLPLLKTADDAAIVHLGSVDGLLGAPAVPSYSASKGGLGPLTRIMAYEFAPYDIRVNMLAACQTIELSDAVIDDAARAYQGFPGGAYMRQLNAATPLKRKGPLTDWAGAAVFLLSPDAAYVTGSVLVVDCGRLAITPGTQIPGR